MGDDNKKSKVTVQESAKKLAKVEESPSWQDAGILMKKGATPKEQAEQKMIIALAVAFDIPPQGITILAGNPYVNRTGLEFVFHKWAGRYGWSHFLSKPVEIAKQAGDTAVFKTTLYNKKGEPIANGYGTANAGNIKMSTIKVFLNEMAETRSQNRCLRKVLSPILYKNFIKNVMRLDKDQKQIVADAAVNFGSVTAEEINGGSEEVSPETLLSEKEMKAISGILQGITNAKDQKSLVKAVSLVKTGKKIGKYNDGQVKVLKEAYITKLKKLSFDK